MCNEDLRLLEGYGLVGLGSRRKGKGRNPKAPEAMFDEIAVKIAI